LIEVLTIKVPDFLEKDYEDTVRFLAAKLYESGKLSLGQAAQMAEMNKWKFAEILGTYGVNYFRISVDLIDRVLKEAGEK